MALCLDTDVLVLLVALDLLDEASRCLGTTPEESFRLEAATSQVRRARWVTRSFPKLDRERAAETVGRLRPLGAPRPGGLLDTLASIQKIDAGEALMLAAAHERSELILLSGDFRMLEAFGRTSELPIVKLREALRRRIVLLPDLFAEIARKTGLEAMDRRWRASDVSNRSLKILFGSQLSSMEELEQAREALCRDAVSLFGPDYFFSF